MASKPGNKRSLLQFPITDCMMFEKELERSRLLKAPIKPTHRENENCLRYFDCPNFGDEQKELNKPEIKAAGPNADESNIPPISSILDDVSHDNYSYLSLKCYHRCYLTKRHRLKHSVDFSSPLGVLMTHKDKIDEDYIEKSLAKIGATCKEVSEFGSHGKRIRLQSTSRDNIKKTILKRRATLSI